MIKDPKRKFFSWLEKLSKFRFESGHRPGELNLSTESPNRCDYLPIEPEEEWVEAIQEENWNMRNTGQGQQDDPATVKVRGWESNPSKQWLVLSNLLDAVFRWSL